MTATGIVALFSLLSAVAGGAGGSITGPCPRPRPPLAKARCAGMLACLSAFRFLLGIGVGAEYPCGSVAASEQSEEEGIPKNSQHRWFALATSPCPAFPRCLCLTRCRRDDRHRLRRRRLRPARAPLDVRRPPRPLAAPANARRRFKENHLRAVWRLSLGLGVIPAGAVFLWRLRMEEPTVYKQGAPFVPRCAPR